jgi:AT-rich interactive domain-containing protein 2
MTTLPPIQPRPILCKTPTNNIQQSSVFLIHSSTQPSTVINTNFYPTNSDLTNNNSSQISLPPPAPPPSTPLSSYEEFLKRLREFHRCRQTTFRCLPTIAGQVVDLQALYTTVIGHGGWDKVNDRQLWPTIANNFGIDSTCVNGTQALKNIYIRYLYAYEKISNGENIDSRDDDDEDSKRRNVSQLQRVPQSYNHAQHSVSDSLRAQYGLFRDFIRRSEYEKLELALLCGFPNELTFTLNTLLLLSSTTTNNSITFHLYKCPRLLDILYCHIGLFTKHNEHYLKTLYDNIWSKHLNYHMEQFWINSCSSDIVKQLLNIDINHNFDEYFNINFNNNQQQQELRIEQILMIIRNLSFDRSNAIYLLDTIRSSNSLTYKFLLLISYCEKKLELQKYAYDIWTNLALYMHLRLISHDEGYLIRQLLNSMLNGNDNNQQQQQDRLKIIRALEIISNLAHAGNDNGIYLIDFIDIIIQRYIHISDILVLVHTLECLYQLSELGEYLCNAILKVQSSIPIITTLIDLLTIEARSFSSQTIKTIKIVEMSTGPVLLPSYHQPPLTQQTSNISQSVVVIPTNQQQTYAIENTEINKSYYSNNNKLIIQQHSKPMNVANVISSGNLLAVATPSTTPIIVANTNAQANQIIDKKRKHDCKFFFYTF